ncbi:hypothetical protein BYT27DRAFT_7132843 [Phlegmacium glaucopus]|nr:hypothetical protein BYT27DRAFT_7132843 [Phlegmacium glaucopus]
MEKFSAFRDPGTGIQPFLTPVPPLGSALIITRVLLPFRYILAIIRTLLVLLLALVYVTLVRGICLILLPIPPLYRLVEHLFTYIIGRSALFILGLFWISIEQVSRKRGKGLATNETWKPRAGDIIVSNWASWIDVVWLAIRFNPIFVLPITDAVPASSRLSTPIKRTPGRRTGTGSANIQSPATATVPRIPIHGFQVVSLLKMITFAGCVTPFDGAGSGSKKNTLEDIRRTASRPIVVFPECTTSNGRGLLRFADVFHQNVPVKKYQVFILCVRYDPPTIYSPTLSHSIPSNTLNPLSHVFSLGMSISSAQMSIRLLKPSESPSSQLFIASEILSDYAGEDPLSETCAALIAHIGKLKRTGMGWEEKGSFLEFYNGKSKSR